MSERIDVVVVGAGLAGLTAARELVRAGRRVVVVDREDEPGGRVRSRVVEGHILDRGFQVLFPAYPAVRRQLDLARLDLVRLPSGAAIRSDGGVERLGWPLDAPEGALSSLAASWRARSLTTSDKLRVARLAAWLAWPAPERLLRGAPFADDDTTTLRFLRAWGFSERAIDRFFRPFFGGIFLDRSLGTSARLFRYYFRMLLAGGAAIPRRGMGEIARQLAAGLEVRTGVRVTGIESGGDGVRVVSDAGELDAAAGVVAVDPPEAARLTGIELPTAAVGSRYLSYSAETAPEDEPRLILNADPGAISNALWISAANPAAAPPGRHLLSVTVLGTGAGEDDATLDAAVRDELRGWYGADAVAGFRLLAVERIPFAQYAQPPGSAESLPGVTTPLPKVWLASEAVAMSSIQGAMEAGERAAAAVLGRPAPHPRGG